MLQLKSDIRTGKKRENNNNNRTGSCQLPGLKTQLFNWKILQQKSNRRSGKNMETTDETGQEPAEKSEEYCNWKYES
jgi:hypothetical protein